MKGDEASSGEGGIPKLTISQRILAALPNLDRQKASDSRSAPARAAGSSDTWSSQSAGKRPPVSAKPVEPDAVISGSKGASGASTKAPGVRDGSSKTGRVSSTTQRPDPTANMSNDELIEAIKRIDDRERKYALISGPLGAAFGIGLTIAAIHTNPALHHKGHVAESTIIFEGVARVVFGAAVFGIAFTRRRSLVAFALMFLGLTVLPFGVVFLGLGGWMLLRASRYQKALTARGVNFRRPGVAKGPKEAARSGSADARERSRVRRESRDRRKGKQPVQTGPAASKRYTPPKPPDPRRERPRTGS